MSFEKMSNFDLTRGVAAMQGGQAVGIFADGKAANFSKHLGISGGFFNANIPGASAAPVDMVRNEIH